MVQIKMGPEYELVCAPQRKDESSNNHKCLLETANDPQNRTQFLNPTAANTIKIQNADVNFFLRKRYLFCFLKFIGMFFIMVLRTNLSIAIVEMSFGKNVTLSNGTVTKKAEFDWDSKTRGFLLSAFSLGYLFSPVGGLLAIKFGGVTIFGLGIAGTALLTLFTPLLIRINFYLYFFARVIEGVFEGCSIATISDMLVRWAPPNERSRLVVLSFSGAFVGAAICYPLSGFLAHMYGWEVIFYFTGGSTLIWCIIWFLCTSNNPTTDTLMTRKERDYFKNFVASHSKKKNPIPWRKMMKSKPFWAYLNEQFSFFWFNSFILFAVPLYVKDAFNFPIEDVGFISSVPLVGSLIGQAVGAFIADILRSNGIFSLPYIHRGFIAFGQFSCIVCLMFLIFWANLEQSIIFLTAARSLLSIAEVSYHVLPIDLFFDYAGIAKGFSLTAMSIASFLNPIVMGYMVADHTIASWNLYFFVLCVFNIWSFVIYFFYGSGELQEWAAPNKEVIEDNRTLEEK